MSTISTVYSGNLRTQATHNASGNTIITDAPTDNNGRGEAFSPSDLVCAALGSCMLTIMGIVAERNNIQLEGTTLEIKKIMAAEPRRIAEVVIGFNMPDSNTFTDKEKAILENAARTCPVALSLHPEIKQTVAFNY
ncbi:OsmC family protein [Adhaeribacter soli]|uniref:OsmC family protein n=1 Tax=Adhaeribacter soli TaxID=2607655 RepID=A0A5N1IPS9_9BACT|nr:OsmC family protein [Adhaeribacter soli]KAA9331971.1 OsmC family protein [Adhaeribacter soli]